MQDVWSKCMTVNASSLLAGDKILDAHDRFDRPIVPVTRVHVSGTGRYTLIEHGRDCTYMTNDTVLLIARPMTDDETAAFIASMRASELAVA